MLGKKIKTQTHVWREILKKIVGDYGNRGHNPISKISQKYKNLLLSSTPYQNSWISFDKAPAERNTSPILKEKKKIVVTNKPNKANYHSTK